jgi:hypothetical protein
MLIIMGMRISGIIIVDIIITTVITVITIITEDRGTIELNAQRPTLSMKYVA